MISLVKSDSSFALNDLSLFGDFIHVAVFVDWLCYILTELSQLEASACQILLELVVSYQVSLNVANVDFKIRVGLAKHF